MKKFWLNATKGKMLTLVLVLTFFTALLGIQGSLAEDIITPIINSIVGTDANSPTPMDSAPPGAPTELPSISPSVDSSPAPSDSSMPSPLNSISDSPTPSATPSPHVTAAPNFHLYLPNVLSVDPRAHSIFIPRISLSGADQVLACGYAEQAFFQLTPVNADTLNIGNGTNSFRVSGSINSVLATLNGEMGLRIYSPNHSIANTYLSIAFVPVSEASIDAKLCSEATSGNTRIIRFQPMDLSMNTVKESVKVK